MPRARQKAAGSIPAAAAAGQAAASRSSVDATTYDWARSAAISKESRLGPQLSYEAKLMQGFVRAGRQGNLPLERLSVNDARLMAQADLSPADMHFVHKGIMNRGLESPDFESQLTGDEARVFGRIKSGGSPVADMRVDRASPFGNLILQGEGRESETDAADVIKIGWRTDQNAHAGGAYEYKLYYPYLDSKGIRTIGPGLRMYDEDDLKDLEAMPGAHIRPDQVKSGKIQYLTATQVQALFQTRADRAKTIVKNAMPGADFLSDYRQAVAVSMAYNMGKGDPASGRGFRGFKEFIKHAENGDYYNAGLEMLRSDRSEDIKGRNLWEALIFLTDGDPDLTGEDRLNDYKDKVEAAYAEQHKYGYNKTYAQVMEELYISEAAKLGYSPKNE